MEDADEPPNEKKIYRGIEGCLIIEDQTELRLPSWELKQRGYIIFGIYAFNIKEKGILIRSHNERYIPIKKEQIILN